METLFDWTHLQAEFIAAWRAATQQALALLPSLALALGLISFGWLVSRALEWGATRALRTVGFDAMAARAQVAGLMERAGVRRSASQLVGRVFFWVSMLVFLVSGVEILGLSAVQATLDRLIGFVPNLLAAALIAVAGIALGRVASAVAASASAAAGQPNPLRTGNAAQLVVTGLVLVLAVEQLGLDTAVLIIPISVGLGVAGLTVGLAVALGARPVISHILAGHFLKSSLPRDSVVEIASRRGVVERVDATETILRDERGSFSVPNARLLEEIVVRP